MRFAWVSFNFSFNFSMPLHSKFFYNRSVKRYAYRVKDFVHAAELRQASLEGRDRETDLMPGTVILEAIVAGYHLSELKYQLPYLARRALYYALGC
jgi:hypothetical protein